MWRFLKVTAALLFSSAVSAIAVALISASPGVVTIAFWIALAHATILGGPLIVIFWWKRWINSFTATVAGFGVGAIGVAIFTWPLRHQDLQSSAWSNGIQTMVDGAPTFAGWLQYLYGVGTFGAFGALGGFAFWLWLRLGRELSLARPKETNEMGASARRYNRFFWPVSAPIALAVAVLSVPVVTMDRSCHNVLRDGRSHIGSRLNIDLDIAHEDWPALQQLFESFAEGQNLSFRDSSEDRPDVVRTLYLSVCSDDGVTISTAEQRWAIRDYQPTIEGRGVGIAVYDTLDRGAWHDLARRLIADLEAVWPTQVRFRDGDGRVIEEPEVLYRR